MGRAAIQVEWGGASGALASALHSNLLQGRGLETLEISETTTEEDEGEEEGREACKSISSG